MSAFKRSNKLSFLIKPIILIFLVIGFASISMQNLIKYKEIKNQRLETEALIEQEMLLTEDIMKQREYRQTDEFIEKVAREKLKLIKPDEIIFKKAN